MPIKSGTVIFVPFLESETVMWHDSCPFRSTHGGALLLAPKRSWNSLNLPFSGTFSIISILVFVSEWETNQSRFVLYPRRFISTPSFNDTGDLQTRKQLKFKVKFRNRIRYAVYHMCFITIKWNSWWFLLMFPPTETQNLATIYVTPRV